MVMLSSASRIFFTPAPPPRFAGCAGAVPLPSGPAARPPRPAPAGSTWFRGDVPAHPVDHLLGRRPRGEDGADARLEQPGSVLVRDDAAAEQHDILALLPLEEPDDLRKQGHVRSRQDRQADAV